MLCGFKILKGVTLVGHELVVEMHTNLISGYKLNFLRGINIELLFRFN